MESLERPNALAKQVLSQLSYTPTVGTTVDFRAFAIVRKLRNIPFHDFVYRDCYCQSRANFRKIRPEKR